MTEIRDVYSRITGKIIADLEQGIRPWHKPWNADHAAGTRPLRHNGFPYKGINVVMLWSAAETKGYACPLWLTFKQAIELGGHVRKGEAGELVVYANSITRTETDAKGEETDREIPYMKGYTVFNAEQCEGLPAHYSAKAEPPALTPMQCLDAADRFFAATGVEIRHGGTRAYCAEGPDYVQMPPFETFRDAESYAATLAHEPTHSTKHAKRLARDLGRGRHGDEGYAREELVAELGAAFLCADLGLTPEVREDHAAYIASWITVLKDDKRAISAPPLMRSAPRNTCTACNRGRPRRAGPPRRRPGFPPWPCPASSRSTAAAIYGATWWRCVAPRRRPLLYSRRYSLCAKITGPPASATPRSVIGSRACSRCLSGAVENRREPDAEPPVAARQAVVICTQRPRLNDCKALRRPL
jgi:antirestriction protein ArdC